MEEEKKWAEQLQQARRQIKKGVANLQTQKNQLKKDMQDTASFLITSANQKDYEKTHSLFFEMVEYLAKTTAICMVEAEKKNDNILSEKLSTGYIKEFKKKCIKLAISVDTILEKN